jgi:membrane AbrB-like protein
LRWAGWDPETGFYASAPGALSSVLALAHAAGVDVRRVAFSQTVRVFLLIASLPGVLALLNQGGTGAVIVGMPTGGDIGEIVLMASAGVAAGLLADRFNVPGGLIVGAMAASAVMHATGYVSARLPLYALVPGFIVLGALIGARFIGTDLSMVRRMLLDSVGAFFVSIFVTVFFALAAAPLAGESLGKTIVAFAPGALEAMIILAFMLDLDPAFVGAHHLARFLLISVLLPFAAYLVFGRPGLKR